MQLQELDQEAIFCVESKLRLHLSSPGGVVEGRSGVGVAISQMEDQREHFTVVQSLQHRFQPAVRKTTNLEQSEPILFQVGYLGKSYKDWVHRPSSGQPRFFSSALLESITKTPWWVVPLVWSPALIYMLGYTFLVGSLSCAATSTLVATGFGLWQALEYVIHRFIFHTLPANYWGITVHFMLHGCHHKYPMDAMRLVFPPLPAAAIAGGIYLVLTAVAPKDAVLPLFAGIISGYLAYDCLHYCMHHSRSVRSRWLASLRKAHLGHHYRDPDAGFGISSPLLDVLLATQTS